MDASHERLAKSKEEYEKQTPLLTKSRRLLSKMSWHSVLDAFTLYGCLAIFFLVVAYILQKRLIYFVPSFLIPSFGRSSALGQQSPAGAFQSPGLPPSITGVDHGSAMGPSVGGPPSNHRWYEAQPGYDAGEKIGDDRWYDAQPDTPEGPHYASEFSADQQHLEAGQQLSASDLQHQSQQQQRQLEEAYREVQEAANAHGPASQPEPVSTPVDPNFEATGPIGQALLRPLDRASETGNQAAAQAADSQVDDVSVQIDDASVQMPISRSDEPKPMQVGAIPRGPSVAAAAPAAASENELGIRQELRESTRLDPAVDTPQADSTSPAAMPQKVEDPEVLEDVDSPHEPGLTQPKRSSDLPDDPETILQQPDEEQQPSAFDVDSNAAADLDTYPGLEKAAAFDAQAELATADSQESLNVTALDDGAPGPAKAAGLDAHPELEKVDTTGVSNVTASDDESFDLDAFPGLEGARVPDASQATDTSAVYDDLPALNGPAAPNVTASGKEAADVDGFPGLEGVSVPDASQATDTITFYEDLPAVNETAAPTASLAKTPLNDSDIIDAFNSSVSKAGMKLPPLLNESLESGMLEADPEFTEPKQPGTPGQEQEAGLLHPAAPSADDPVTISSSLDSGNGTCEEPHPDDPAATADPADGLDADNVTQQLDPLSNSEDDQSFEGQEESNLTAQVPDLLVSEGDEDRTAREADSGIAEAPAASAEESEAANLQAGHSDSLGTPADNQTSESQSSHDAGAEIDEEDAATASDSAADDAYEPFEPWSGEDWGADFEEEDTADDAAPGLSPEDVRAPEAKGEASSK